MTQQHRHTAKIIEDAVLVFHIYACVQHNSEHTEETQKLAKEHPHSGILPTL